MKILIVSDIPTSPINAGNRKLISSYVSLFKQWGHEVHFLYVYRYYMRNHDRMEAKNAIPNMRQKWGKRFHLYKYNPLENLRANVNIILGKVFNNGYRTCDGIYPSGLTREIQRLHEVVRFDALLVNYFYLSKALEAMPIKRKALFTHDSFSLHEKSKRHKAAYYLTPEEERKALERAPYIFAMQDIEAEYFKKLVPSAKVLINYSNYKYHEQPTIGNHDILFFSGASSFNLQGLTWFIKEVFPLIRNEFHDVRLHIAGSICKMVTRLDNFEGIDLCGYVNNPYDFFMKGDVAINPCQVGTGLKIKTFEAVSYDKVTMVHPHSLVGIFKKDEAPIFASTHPEDWIDYLHKVWGEKDFISAIKAKDRNYIKDMNSFVENEYHIWLGH